MKVSELKNSLERNNKELNFYLPNGTMVPSHYHLTEIGVNKKVFVDCGGKYREESKASLQLWVSVDIDHRLERGKFLNIIKMAEERIGLTDLEIEVQYQGETINIFGLENSTDGFKLVNLQTDCLAKDNCGIPVEKIKKPLSSLSTSCCTPGGGWC